MKVELPDVMNSINFYNDDVQCLNNESSVIEITWLSPQAESEGPPTENNYRVPPPLLVFKITSCTGCSRCKVPFC